VQEPCALIRTENECFLHDLRSYQQLEDCEPLLSFTPNEGNFVVKAISNDPEQKVWSPIRYLKDACDGYMLTEGDWLKLGRIVLHVKKMCVSKPYNSDFAELFVDNASSNSVSVSEVGEKVACRICLDEAQTEEDKLIGPCKCSGSMRLIHISCLRQWLKSKVITRQSGKTVSYYWNDLTCELCKEPFPSTVVVAGKRYDLISITYPKEPFIILEDYRPDKNEIFGKHIVSLKERQSITVGRGHDSDLKLTDISVSRKHSRIFFSRGKFYVRDYNSKFGTLIRLKKTFKLEASAEIAVQLNRSLVCLTLKRPWSCLECLCCCSFKKVAPISDCSYVTETGKVDAKPGRAFVSGDLEFFELPMNNQDEGPTPVVRRSQQLAFI